MFGFLKRKRSGHIRPPAPKRHPVIEYTKSIGSAILIALVLRQFVFQAFRIPTGSMLETLQIGDFLFVNKFLYGAKTPDRIRIPVVNWTIIDGLPVLKAPALREPRQGDIIVFEYPEDRNIDFIKRCVAVAGDTVAVREGVLRVPTSAIQEGGTVLVAGAGGELEQRSIKPGLANWEYTEVLEGLQAGDKVVTSLEREGVKAGVRYSIDSGKGK